MRECNLLQHLFHIFSQISFGDKFGVEWSNFEELVLHCKKLKLDVKGNDSSFCNYLH